MRGFLEVFYFTFLHEVHTNKVIDKVNLFVCVCLVLCCYLTLKKDSRSTRQAITIFNTYTILFWLAYSLRQVIFVIS